MRDSHIMTQALQTHNPREHIGANNPPIDLPPELTEKQDPLQFAFETYTVISDWLKEVPTIGLGKDHLAREAKAHRDVMKGALDSLEKHRDGLVRPLNEQVKTINANIKLAVTPCEKLTASIDALLTGFAKAERDERERILRVAREKEAEARRAAEEALRIEREAMESPMTGEFVDLGAAILNADHAVYDANRASNMARVAARDASSVKIGGGTGRSVSLRTVKTFAVKDIDVAVKTMIGKSPEIPVKLVELLVAWARKYEQDYKVVPDGFAMSTEERV